jgi:hypothetical protein
MAIQPGDKGLDWLDRLAKTYAANYFHGMYPGAGGGWNQPILLAEADLPSTAAVILYDSVATAKANGVTNPTIYQLFRSLDIQMLEPEANDIYVEGYDWRTGRPLLAHKFDSVNADPTVIPANRTPAWRGQRIKYTWIDPTLTDMPTILYAMGLLYPRLTIARSMCEFESDFQYLRRGQLVTLYFADGGGVPDPATGIITNPVTLRVKSLSGKFDNTGADGKSQQWFPTRYIGQVGMDLHTRTARLSAIGTEWSLRAVSKTVQWGFGSTGVTNSQADMAWIRPLLEQQEAS